MKACRTCRVEKPLGEFYKRRESVDGHCHECMVCLKARTSQDQKHNHAGRLAKNRKWRSQNLERERQRNRDRYPGMKEFYLEQGRIERKEKPHLFRARLARRRAAKLNATPPWVDHDAITAIYAEAARTGMHVDHIIPLQGKNVCGLHVPWNLQLLPPIENQRKSNKFTGDDDA